MSPVAIHSEIGALRRVVVHLPGQEIVRMMAEDFESLLFDDLLSPVVARREHALMCEVLEHQGAEVLEVMTLLASALRNAPSPEVASLVVSICEDHGVIDLAPILEEIEPDRLARILVQGVTWQELPKSVRSLRSLRATVLGDERFALAPIPNLMFMRDPGISVYDRVVVSRMGRAARRREPLLVRFALTWAPESGLGPDKILALEADTRLPLTLEGGDVLIPSPSFMMIGCSVRTSAQGIERMAREVLFPAFPRLERIHAVLMPRARTVMHLDTILTQVDRQLFLGFPPMITGPEGLRVATLTRDDVVLHAGTVEEVLAEELDGVEIVPCGGHEELFQRREQWTDGANAVCTRPGHIILYERNVETINTLVEEHGFQVCVLSSHDAPDQRQARLEVVRDATRVAYAFTGAELSRARGGGRCLTMPLLRDPISAPGGNP